MSLIDQYPGRVQKCLKDQNSRFLITSCNWTVAELRSKLAGPDSGLEYASHVPRPTFIFGGHQGSTISTVAFRLRKS